MILSRRKNLYLKNKITRSNKNKNPKKIIYGGLKDISKRTILQDHLTKRLSQLSAENNRREIHSSTKFSNNLSMTDYKSKIDINVIKTLLKPIEYYLKSSIELILNSINIEYIYTNTTNLNKFLKLLSIYPINVLSKDEIKKFKTNDEILKSVIDLFNKYVDKEKLKYFGLTFPIDNSNIYILINLMYLLLKNANYTEYTTSTKFYEEYLIRLSKEKRSIQKKLYEENQYIDFKYLSEQKRQELILMIKERINVCIHNYETTYNILKIFFTNKIPLQGHIINSVNYKEQIYKICKKKVSSVILETGKFDIPIDDKYFKNNN